MAEVNPFLGMSLEQLTEKEKNINDSIKLANILLNKARSEGNVERDAEISLMLNRFITARKHIHEALAQVHTYISNPNKERRMLNDFARRKAGRHSGGSKRRGRKKRHKTKGKKRRRKRRTRRRRRR